MTSPIQVVPVPGIGDELQKAISPLIEAYQRRQQLELQQEQLKLRQQELKQQQAERKEQQAQLGATGEMLRTMLVAQDQEQVTMPDVPSIPSPIGMGSAFMSLEGGRQVTGLGPIAMAARAAPATAIPGAVELSRDIRQTITEQRAGARADIALEGLIRQRTDPEEQASLRQLVHYRRFGIDLPIDAQRALFPKLFPQGVDPQVATAMLRFGVAGGLSWGQIRSQFGQPSVPGGIPDDFKFPITTGAAKGTERQQVAQFHYSGMSLSGPMIDRLVYGYVDDQGNTHEGSGGMSEFAVMKRAADMAVNSGNTFTAFMGALGQIGGNRLLSDEQRALLDATYKYSNSLRYLMTGAQSNAQEFNIILNSIVEWQTDDAQTKAQKAAYRQVMTEAARNLAAGNITAAQAGNQLVQQAQSQGFNADFQQMMKSWSAAATDGGTVPLLDGNPNHQMSNEDILNLITNSLGEQQRRSFIMGNQP